jgi:hypothetical protein
MGQYQVLTLLIADWRSRCHVPNMANRRLRLHLKAAQARRDLSAPLTGTGCKVILFSFACLLAWGVPTFHVQSQGQTPVIFSAKEVETSFIEQTPRFRQRALTYPAELLAQSYFSEAHSAKELPHFLKFGVNVISMKNGVPQIVTKENVDAYTKGYSGWLAIMDQAIRQRGFRQVGGTFVMNVESNCKGFNDGTVSIVQSDFRIKLASGWPALVQGFEGLVVEDTIAVGTGALGDTEKMIGLGKLEAGRAEIKFGNCKVTLRRL